MTASSYRQRFMQGVSHTTLNPYGPGCVRIHLVPPRPSLKAHPSVAILNGRDVISLKPAWAILLNEFIREVNYYEGRSLDKTDLKEIINTTAHHLKQVYRKTDESMFRQDLELLVDSLCKIAWGQQPTVEVGYMSMKDYAPFMRAPHRMDLMVSAMTKNGCWNCNQKCLHCYAANQSMAEAPELSTAEWKRVLDTCREIGIPQVTFTGGEPTMRRDLVELVEHAAWFVTRLNTNGVLMTPELCQGLYRASLDSVQITFYSNNAEQHNRLVGANNFDKTLQGIKNALVEGLSVSINTPLCTVNRDYVSTLKALHEIGVQYVTCSGLIVTGNARQDDSARTQLNEDELFAILKDATKFCADHDMEISFTTPGWVAEDKLQSLGLTVPTCGACLSNMAVAPDGSVVPCQSWLSADAPLGNILTDSWSKIWNSRSCKEKRKFSSECAGICPLKQSK